jgi:hypothetical protein
MELEEDLNFWIHNLIKINVQIKKNITVKCEGMYWHCDHLQQTELKASSYDQVQSLNIITKDDALNIPSCFRLHWTSPCPLGSHKQTDNGRTRQVTWLHLQTICSGSEKSRERWKVDELKPNDETRSKGPNRVSQFFSQKYFIDVLNQSGDRGSTVVKVLRYKSEGRWFDPRWCHGICHWHKSFWSHYDPGVD